MKTCSKCGIDDSQKPFRKNRSQCNDCFNAVRRAGSKKKIGREQAILEEMGQPVLDKYRKNYIDSTLGYTKDNVRLVCTIVNMALNEFGDIIFDKMCRAYVENTLRSK